MASGINTTSTLSNSHRTRYQNEYEKGMLKSRLYDDYSVPIARSIDLLQRASSVTIPFLSGLQPGTASISETVDVVPQRFRDATVSITPTSRGEAIQDSEINLLQTYTDYGAERFRRVGENAAYSIDLLAQEQALTGDLVFSAVARASLDAGTAAHRLTEAEFTKAENLLIELMSPTFDMNTWAAVVPNDAYYDLRTGGNIVSIAQYQKAEIILNHELGMLGRFRIVTGSPNIKVFGGAGADNGSAVATTLSAQANRLAKQITVASASNITAGRYLTIGTEETGSTHYGTNERVRVADSYTSGTTVDIVGSGDNGGLRFDHESAEAVRNADSVYPVLFAGPDSMVKLYAVEIGQFGQIVGPQRQGLLDQWISLGWKYYGGYGRIAENRMVRGEYASSLDA